MSTVNVANNLGLCALAGAALLLGCSAAGGSDPQSAVPDDAGAQVDTPTQDAPSVGVDAGLIIDASFDGSISDGASNCTRESEIKALVRDFRGWAAASGSRHPDFEGDFFGFQGIVRPELGSDGRPAYAHTGPTPATTGPAEFDQWYRDVPGVNMRFDDVVLPLTEDPSRPGTYIYDDQDFFPIDGRGWGEGFGNNFHFTTEIHIKFTYRGGEVFTFIGDDDLFLFVNGRLAVDLGGVHPAQTGTVDLDAQAAELGIQRNGTYDMDIFQAERHTTFSTFRIETSLQCFKTVIPPPA